MSRLFMLMAIAVAIYLLIKSFSKKDGAPQDVESAEDMIRCEYCGVHLPRSEGVRLRGKFYCCKEHGDATSQ